ncbi:MAG: DUF11 domain-containing protein, partial [Planctomycetes bacterium]|nr:DUF11 domain-containing protein [Planctomycetota bacterium]
MKGIQGIWGLALLTAILTGWGNVSLAQQPLGKITPTEAGPADPMPLALPTVTPPGPGAAPGAGPGLAATGPAAPAPAVAPAQQPQAQAEDTDLGPGVDRENPTGRQEPAVSLEWIGPPLAKVGRPGDYTVVVRNACNIAIQEVMVRVRIPAGMVVKDTEPKAVAEGNVLMWKLDTMLPKQEKNLNMKLIPEGRGNVGCQAWVTFTGSSAMKIRICEPKLVLKATAPEKVMVGDVTTFVLTVTNPGDGPAEMVKIHATLSDGLENNRGKNVDFDISNPAPNESRSVTLICGTRAGGPQTCDGIAEADGDLRSQDRASVNVIMPRLELEASGPRLRYLDRKAVYTFKVVNPGDASATNVTISDIVPPGFKFVSASDGGRHDFSTRTVSWFLGEVGPTQSKEVKMEVVAINPGEFHHKVSAQAARGLKVDQDVITNVEGLSAILLEVVDTEDPIEVGADTSYEIRVTNTGSKTETDIKMVCTIPDKEQFKGAQAPVRYHEQGKEIVFEPLPK